MLIIWIRNCCMFCSACPRIWRTPPAVTSAQPDQQVFFSSGRQFISVKNLHTINADNMDKKLLHVLLSMSSNMAHTSSWDFGPAWSTSFFHGKCIFYHLNLYTVLSKLIIWIRNFCMFCSACPWMWRTPPAATSAQPDQQVFFSSSMQFLSIKNLYTINADNLDKKLLHVLLSMSSNMAHTSSCDFDPAWSTSFFHRICNFYQLRICILSMLIIWKRNCCMFCSACPRIWRTPPAATSAQPDQRIFFYFFHRVYNFY